MLKNLDYLLAYAKEARTVKPQDSLFSLLEAEPAIEALRLEPAEPINATLKLAWEKELLGLYISGHPLERFKHELEFRKSTVLDVKEKAKEKSTVTLCGIIEDVKVILTKKGDKMAFVRLADLSGSIELVLFPDTYKRLAKFFEAESCVCVLGQFSRRNGEASILVEKTRFLKDKDEAKTA